MRAKDDLDRRFTSDHYWNAFVRACEQERWRTCPDAQAVIIALRGRKDMAVAAWAAAAAGYHDWFMRPNPTIGGQQPMELLSSGTSEDELRLRALLMQQPP